MVPETVYVAPETVAVSTSTIVRLYWSFAGAVSLMVTVVPVEAVGAFCRCTQYVSPTDARYWFTIAWLAPMVRCTALSQSVPTPNIQELFRVVTSDAVGAPGFEFPLPVAPIAPEPFVPDVSTPVKLTTVMEAATLCDRFATTVTFESLAGASARQISAVPS
jgi:hypothetical protein